MILGRYEAWGRLSAGGMSEVWLARHAALAMPAIVKTVRPDVAAASPEAEAMLVSTARMVARLSSPHVVRVLDTGTASMEEGAPEVPCVVEEYVDGIDLGELDRARRAALGRALPLWAVADLVAEAAAGLHAAHQAGILHRDVKPTNLFADPHGRVKVGDFGVAVAAHGERAERPAGTPDFMAPEQWRAEPCDRRADVYALGASAFALRYGRPRSGSTPTGRRAPSPPEPLPAARTPEEAYFQHVVQQAMAQAPDARPATARHVEAAMRTIAEGIRPRLSCARLGPATYSVGETRLVLAVGDLAEAEADAIVASAYSGMSMRSGAGDALRRRGGDAIEEEALRGGPRALGECVATGAGSLRCKSVLHAVGAWKEVSCIARATWRALLLAEAGGHRTIAMPAIGTGRGKVSLASCADTLASVLRLHLALGGSRLREVRVVLYDEASLRAFDEVTGGLFLGTERRPEDDGETSEEVWNARTLLADD